MAELSPTQFSFLTKRAEVLDSKPCPVCDKVSERVLHDEVYQFASIAVDKDGVAEDPIPYIPVGIVRCPECNHLEIFMLPDE